jgi:hypothetical protein
MIEIRPANTRREKHIFLTFPWRIYKKDPLWVPPILSERVKATDPARGMFFKAGYADFFIAWRDDEPAGTICCSHENGGDPGECSLGFFECIDDYSVAEAMFGYAEGWARQRKLTMLCGTYNLDREDGRGILVEGRDRPPVILCGHNPPYYLNATDLGSAMTMVWLTPASSTQTIPNFNAYTAWQRTCVSVRILLSAL